MAPGFRGDRPDPLGNVGLRLPNSNAPINLGVPILLGGAITEPTLKIGPGEPLTFKIGCPLAAEGGLTINTHIRVRAWIVKVKGEDTLLRLMRHYGHLDASNRCDAGIEIGDVEVADVVPLRSRRTNNPIVNFIPKDGPFTVADWQALPGGNDQRSPKLNNFITYAQNSAATATSDAYEFTQMGSHVNKTWQELKFKPDKKTVYHIERVGVLSHANLKYLELYRSGRPIDQQYQISANANNFPLPADVAFGTQMHKGFVKLPRPFTIWNEIGSINVKANGTAIPAWSASDRGTLIAIMGKKLELPEGY